MPETGVMERLCEILERIAVATEKQSKANQELFKLMQQAPGSSKKEGEPAPSKTEPKKKKKKPVKEEEKPAPEPKKEKTTKDEVIAVCRKYVGAWGQEERDDRRDRIKKLLSEYEVERIAELNEESYAEFAEVLSAEMKEDFPDGVES